MIGVKRLKEIIKAEYGGITEWCKIMGKDRYEMQLFFANCENKLTPERREKLDEMEDELLRNADKDHYINNDLRARMKLAVRAYGGYSKFSSDYPRFSYSFVWEACTNKKWRTNKLNDLIKILGL